MSDSSSHLVVPQKVNGRYDINDPPIGQGGMGVVYKAYDTVTKRFVALKTMWGNVDPAAIELFEREWTVLGRLSHPNIVDILDTGEFRDDTQRKPYFVMPLLPGVTLDHLIKTSSQRLTVERTIEIMCQVCRGLQAAHDHNLVHRDLKPSNIFVMEDDAVKIIDFGVVHLADTRSVTGLKGTMQYMAPEQLEMKPATPMSDIFSLAVVCYEALTKRKPFTGKTEGELVDAIRRHIPPPASDLNAAVNQLVSRTVHKGMAKQPWHRFSSAREFADTLQKAIRNEPIERFDRSKIQPRIDRVKRAYGEGNHQFALEILTELESEGHMDPEMSVLRIQIDQSVRQKTILQLLDSARTRMEEDELPLALQKIQEVLVIDPGNLDASSLKSRIERQRSEKQIENWFRLVREHLDNQLYSQARQGIQEVLKINNSDTRARQLLAEVDRTEEEAIKVRQEKQKLYEAAVASYRNGEISTALTKLERLLDLNRQSPKFIAPDRDAQYQSLYNQIRSERDVARNAYAEGRKHLVDHNFARALEICEEFLRKHPGDPMFQALKIEAEETQRQEQSSAVAEVNRRVEAEPDLDKKYNIVKEAVEKYPNEQHFKSSLKLVKDRRDLINSIVGRAHQYEERAQFNDAAGQWDILRNIYPLYPGLDFEVQRLARRREEQAQDEAKAKWVERVDRYFGAGEYAKAREVVREALVEFPDDKELQGLESLAGQAIKRSSDAGVLLEQGQALCVERKYDEGLDALRKAERLDERNPLIRAALLSAILQRARDLMSSDWRAAEPLVAEAHDLDAGDPVVRSLSSLIEDYKRQEAVGKFVLEARDLQASGDLPNALRKVEEGLRVHPNEIRLSQLYNTLRNAIAESRHSDASSSGAPAVPPPPSQPPSRPPSKKDLPDLPPPVHTTFQPISPVPPSASKSASISADAPTSLASASVPAAKTVPAAPPVKPPSAKAEPKKRGPLLWGAVGVAVLLIAAALFFKDLSHRPSKDTHIIPITKTTPPTVVAPPPPSPELSIASDLKVGAGKFSLDGAPPADLQQGALTIAAGDHTLAILDGNKPIFSFAFHVQPNEIPTLTAPLTGSVGGVVVASRGGTAQVYASAKIKGAVEGQPLQPIPPEGVALTLPAQGELSFMIDDGKAKPQALLIESSAASALSVTLSGTTERIPFTINANVDATVLVNGRSRWTLTAGSRVVSLTPGTYRITLTRDDYQPAPEQVIELKAGDTNQQSLTFKLIPIARDASLAIESAPAGAEVLVDGTHLGVVTPAGTFAGNVSPGSHSVVLRKPNFEDFTASRDFKVGETAKIAADGMKAFGSIAFKVLPSNAHITYRRDGDSTATEVSNNQTVTLRPGSYEVKAEADKFASQTQTVQVASGKTRNLDLTLSASTVRQVKEGPPLYFVNGDTSAWTVLKDGWWVHDGKGLSFFKAGEGNFTIDILKDTQKGVFKSHTKKVQFFADYTPNGAWASYTLDAHNLTRRMYSGNRAGEEIKIPHGMEGGLVYRLFVEITPETVVIRNKDRKVLDTLQRNGSNGKFGFTDEVALSVH